MRILLGMSGGLDSTYSALKLKEEGHTVEGAVLLMHEFTELDGAIQAAKNVDIPIHVIDCKEEFKNKVISDFLYNYRRGRTPNPCIICNSEIKFIFLFDYAQKNGFDMIATGHYAKIVETEDAESGTVRYGIQYAADAGKDQTYMLWRLPQEVLSHLVFPLSEMSKKDVRERARSLGLSVAESKESQEICFVKDESYTDYIERCIGKSAEGDFINENGGTVGRHKGIIHYTVGQRKGLGVSLGQRMFVSDISYENNTVTLSDKPKFSSVVEISGIVFSSVKEMKPGEQARFMAKVRYLAPPVCCRLLYHGDNRATVYLDTPQKSVTAGQSCVLYKDGIVALGGFIDRAE